MSLILSTDNAAGPENSPYLVAVLALDFSLRQVCRADRQTGRQADAPVRADVYIKEVTTNMT
jgi:hypothetical protein